MQKMEALSRVLPAAFCLLVASSTTLYPADFFGNTPKKGLSQTEREGNQTGGNAGLSQTGR
jgi:hypothetical protein